MFMETQDTVNCVQKALALNLDTSIYGTFAEIGAGQEVVRFFFLAGAAAGTIAKSMSAYDMKFSDAIYGEESSGRYVCESRVDKMLDKEFGLLTKRLSDRRDCCKYFAFADTVAARSFKNKEKECHGWLGVRFQLSPDSKPNTIRLHIRLREKENLHQQQTVGKIGVNLVYGAYFFCHDTTLFLKSLLDTVLPDAVDVDMVTFSGPDFRELDNRLESLKLLQLGLTDAIMFNPEGQNVLPSELLYKKPVLIQRGSYRPPTHVNMDVHKCGYAQFIQEDSVKDDIDNIITVKEITMNNLTIEGDLDSEDFLARVDLIGSVGSHTLISNYFEYYRLTRFLGRYTKKIIGVVLGINELKQLFDDTHYSYLEGGLLESFGKLLSRSAKIYVYPMKDLKTGKLVTADNFQIKKNQQSLYHYLQQNGYLTGLTGHDESVMHIFSKEVLRLIHEGDPHWENMVPEVVAEHIKTKALFGYKGNLRKGS